MIKIFDEDVIEYMESVGVSDNQIRAIQFKELKEAVIARLKDVAIALKADNYDQIVSMMEESPSGDGHGCDNHFISFTNLLPNNRDGWDLYSVAELLRRLGQPFTGDSDDAHE